MKSYILSHSPIALNALVYSVLLFMWEGCGFFPECLKDNAMLFVYKNLLESGLLYRQELNWVQWYMKELVINDIPLFLIIKKNLCNYTENN